MATASDIILYKVNSQGKFVETLYATETYNYLQSASASAGLRSLTGSYVGISNHTATGVASATTYLRGDNTWATPLYQLPLNFGADISLYSATKYFSGHSDVMAGIIVCNSELLYKNLKELRFYSGAILEPQSAWLLRRSMQTFAIRMKEHNFTTIILKDFLVNCKQVEKVYYPLIDGEQLTGYGTLIFFDIRENLIEKYHIFANSLKLFDTGTGMACVTSMVAQPYTGSHASMSDNEKTEMNLSKKLIRLSFGLENPVDLIQDLKNAFETIDNYSGPRFLDSGLRC